MESVLAQGWANLKKHPRWLWGYLGGYLLISLSYHGLDYLLADFFKENKGAVGAGSVLLLMLIGLSIVQSAYQAVMYSYLGRLFDWPVWRILGIKDALARFFSVWLIINLGSMLIFRFAVNAAENMQTDTFFMMLFLQLLFMLLSFPFGVCVMHWGHLDWKQLPLIMRPVSSHFLVALPVLFVIYVQFMYMLALILFLPETAADNILLLSMLDVPSFFLEIYCFAGLWQLCMFHRETQHRTSPMDDL